MFARSRLTVPLKTPWMSLLIEEQKMKSTIHIETIKN